MCIISSNLAAAAIPSGIMYSVVMVDKLFRKVEK